MVATVFLIDFTRPYIVNALHIIANSSKQPYSLIKSEFTREITWGYVSDSRDVR